MSSGGMARWLLVRLGESPREWTVTSPKERAFCLTTLARLVADRDEALRSVALARLRFEAGNRGQSSEVRSAALVALGVALMHKGATAAAVAEAGEVVHEVYARTSEPEAKGYLAIALVAAKSHGSRAAIAVSLGSIGDRRAVRPLLDLVADEALPTTTRSMAIVGIGVLCEERSLPWRNPMAHALPYSAMTATLGGQGHAVFDIL